MKIYTKKGDRGTTSLFGGGKVSKNSPRLEAYGAVDELNSHLGLVRALRPPGRIDSILAGIQNDLFVLGAELATPARATNVRIQRIEDADVVRLEKLIDEVELLIPPLRSFILPGGSVGGAQLHIARTVCRRMERHLVAVAKKERIRLPVLAFVNRMSDLFFVLARHNNKLDGAKEVEWPAR